MWTHKNNNEPIPKQKETHRHRKTKVVTKAGRGERNQEYRINRYKLLHIKQISNKIAQGIIVNIL